MSKPLIICIIDDDDVYQYTITNAIKKNSIVKKILVFSDGKEGIDFLIANAKNTDKIPDLIFLDNFMPIVDGWEFLEQYKKIKSSIAKKTSIYMISSSVDPSDFDKASKIVEVEACISKPPSAEEVNKIIELIAK